MTRQRRKGKTQPGRLRIVAGNWRSRLLDIAEVEGLRPTAERVRETLFNWLALHLPGARCLDLFAGTGALGLEALSRGAASVVFVERSPVAARQLEKNIGILVGQRGSVGGPSGPKAGANVGGPSGPKAGVNVGGPSGPKAGANVGGPSGPKQVAAEAAPTAEVIQADAKSWIRSASGPPFDIVFLDPPYAADLLEETCRLLAGSQLLANDALIYLELDRKGAEPALPDGWQIKKNKTAGMVRYMLVQA